MSVQDRPFIFIGPTLPLEEAKPRLDAVYLPPVKYGDVYRITQLYRPRVIGIIDGYFNSVPAVWHKEILYAMNQGTAVFGASSMGALRAAELAPLGMIGCGRIFEAYQKRCLPPYVDEIFEDDDEVAVTHAPAEMGYKALSEAMVNIRFTLAKAEQMQIIDLDCRNSLISIAKALFYPQRSFQQMVKIARQRGMNESILENLTGWVNENMLDQKKADAIELLSHIGSYQTGRNAKKKRTLSAFVHTSQWQGAIDEIDQSHRIDHIALNELRLQGPRYFELLEQACDTFYAGNPAHRIIDPEDITTLHRSTQAINRRFSHDWQLMRKQVSLAQLTAAESDQCLIDLLEQRGELEPLRQRAEQKQAVLSKSKIPDVAQLSEIDLLQLADWYFSQYLDMDLPDQIEDYAADLGFTDMDSFYDMLLKEYFFKQEL